MNIQQEVEKRYLAVKVTPNAGHNEITGFKDDVLHIKIGAPPDKGKANKELVRFLSAKLGIKKSSVLIIRGQASHNKIIAIEGFSREDVKKRLQS